jgi:hypothetical protein
VKQQPDRKTVDNLWAEEENEDWLLECQNLIPSREITPTYSSNEAI